MSSSANFKHLKYGLNLIPNATSLISEPGDIDYDIASGQFNFFSAAGAGHLVIDNAVQTLTNKTINVSNNSIIGTINTAAQFNLTTGHLESSLTTTVELGFVHGVTSSIQAQLNSITGSAITALTGDVTATGPGSSVATLAAVGTAGTYVKVTTDSKGRVISGSVSPLGISDGGTGQSSASAAYNALSPMTTAGDIEYEITNGVAARLPIGLNNQILQVSSGLPSWSTFTALTNPMTSTGDIIYSSDNLGTPARLAIGSSGQMLEVVSGIPAWVNSPSPVYYSGFNPNRQFWTVSSATLVDFTAGNSISLTQRQVSGITVTAASGSLPGITFTPTAGAAYQITAVVKANANVNNWCILSLTDGTAIIQQIDWLPVSTLYDPITLCGIYVPGVTTPVTVKLQGASLTGTLTLGNPSGGGSDTIAPSIEWTIEQLVSSSGGGGGGGVSSINSQTGPAITIAAGSGISVATTTNTVTISNTGAGSSTQIAYVTDQKTQGTNGGSATSGSWLARDLNTLTTANSPSWITNNGTNNFTLTAGTYDIYAESPYSFTNRTQTKLFNTTDSADAIVGTSVYASTGLASGIITIPSIVVGSIVISGTKSFQLQYQCQANSSTTGLGQAANFTTEVYSIVKITKMG